MIQDWPLNLGKSYRLTVTGSIAAQAILHYGFEQLRLSRLICLIDPENHASRKVAEKVGMTLEVELPGIDGDGIPTLLCSTWA